MWAECQIKRVDLSSQTPIDSQGVKTQAPFNGETTLNYSEMCWKTTSTALHCMKSQNIFATMLLRISRRIQRYHSCWDPMSATRVWGRILSGFWWNLPLSDVSRREKHFSQCMSSAKTTRKKLQSFKVRKWLWSMHARAILKWLWSMGDFEHCDGWGVHTWGRYLRTPLPKRTLQKIFSKMFLRL